MLKPGHVPVVVFEAVNAHDAGMVCAQGVARVLRPLAALYPVTAPAHTW